MLDIRGVSITALDPSPHRASHGSPEMVEYAAMRPNAKFEDFRAMLVGMEINEVKPRVSNVIFRRRPSEALGHEVLHPYALTDRALRSVQEDKQDRMRLGL